MLVNNEGLKTLLAVALHGEVSRVVEVKRHNANEVFDLGRRIEALQNQQNEEEMVVMTKAEEMKKVLVDSMMFLGRSHEEALELTYAIQNNKLIFAPGKEPIGYVNG